MNDRLLSSLLGQMQGEYPVADDDVRAELSEARRAAGFQPVTLAAAPENVLSMPQCSLEQKIAKAIAVLRWSFMNYEQSFGYSGGKDSSTMLMLALHAAASLTREGFPVKRFAILSADTLVEQPEVLKVVRDELCRVRQWIKKHNLPGDVVVTKPRLASQFAVSIIGGKSLISTPTTNRNCTTDMKAVPLTATRIRLFGKNKVGAGKFVVNVSGVRTDESQQRKRNMAKRQESPVSVVQTSAAGDVFLAPIADWSTDDVMEFIGLATNGLLPIEGYSDLAAVWRIYKDAEGECQVGRGSKPSKGCSARHGCYICNLVATDKSMNAMLQRDEYAYMQPLADFRTYLANTVHDLRSRAWVGRSIVDGHVVIAPDAYNPISLWVHHSCKRAGCQGRSDSPSDSVA